MAVHLLGLNDDVWFDICEALDDTDHVDLLNLSSTCRRFRTIAAPFVFRKPRLLTDCAEGFSRLPSIDPWLAFVEQSESFLRYMKVLHLRMFSIQAGDSLRLSRILSAAANIQEIRLITPDSRDGCQENLKRAFTSSTLRKLQIFTISAGLEELIPMLTVTKALEIQNQPPYRYVFTDDLQQYIADGHLKRIVSLRLGPATSWSPSLLQQCTEHLPSLRDLGTLRGGRPGYSFEALLRPPGLCPQVTTLSIVLVGDLGLRYYEPDCANEFDLCEPPTHFCEYHVIGALNYAGKLAYTAFSGLQSLTLGGCQEIKCVRDAAGDISHLFFRVGAPANVNTGTDEDWIRLDEETSRQVFPE